jgi:hypothetical protein
VSCRPTTRQRFHGENASEIIDTTKELRLDPTPSGSDPDGWQARRSETNHVPNMTALV